jgi:ABC-type sugar transport system permease subunit
MFKDQYFKISLFNAFFYSIIVVPVQTFLAIVLAVAANSKIKGIKFFKATFFIPAITSSAAISMIFWMIYSRPGILNRLLSTFGFQPIAWLENPNTALPAIMIMNIWTTAGYFMVTFLAGLQDIPTSIYEAAKIDGAGIIKTFFTIVAPNAKPAMTALAIYTFLGAWNDFMWPLIITSDKNMYTLTMGLNFFKTSYYTFWQYMMAASILMTIPMIIIFLFFQNQFIESGKASAIKG